MSAIKQYFENSQDWKKIEKKKEVYVGPDGNPPFQERTQIVWLYEGNLLELVTLTHPFNKLRFLKIIEQEISEPIEKIPFLFKIGEEQFWTKNPANDKETYWTIEVIPVGRSLQDIEALKKHIRKYQLKTPNFYSSKIEFFNEIKKEIKESIRHKASLRKKFGPKKKKVPNDTNHS